MKLFEITTGRMGFAYERAYAWANDEEQARIFANLELPPALQIKEIEELFDASDPPFCTKFSNIGWDGSRCPPPRPRGAPDVRIRPWHPLRKETPVTPDLSPLPPGPSLSPAGFRGGQGRSGQEIEDNVAGLVALVLAAVILIIAITILTWIRASSKKEPRNAVPEGKNVRYVP